MSTELAPIRLKTPKLRDYQERFLFALEDQGYRQAIMLGHRGCGKDVLGWVYAVRCAIRKPCIVIYSLPTHKSARRIIWNGMMMDGTRFLDFIPPELIYRRSEQEMIVTLTNKSQIIVTGSNQFDALRGLSPLYYIASEAAWHDPRAYAVVRPRLTQFDGTALFLTTPRPSDTFKDQWDVAVEHPDSWFTRKYTIEDTGGIVTKEMIAEEMKTNPCMTEVFVSQEYYCDFRFSEGGSILGREVDKMELENRIGTYMWDSTHLVNTCMDIGVRDPSIILWYQVINNGIYIIDSYAKSNMGLQHYIDVIKSKPYRYGVHVAPHDIRNRDFSSGATAVSRIAIARLLGIDFVIAPDKSEISRADGIAKMQMTCGRMFIDEQRCEKLIKAMRYYQYEYDHEKGRFKDDPLHNWASDHIDALRYLSISLHLIETNDSTPEQLDKRYRDSVYGPQFTSGIPGINPFKLR